MDKQEVKKREEQYKLQQAYLGINSKEEKLTFATIAKDWLKEVSKNLGKHSQYVYNSAVNKYIIPGLGKLTIDELEDYDYMTFVNSLGETLEPKTARDITTKLKSILCYAEDTYDLRIRIRKIKLPALK